MATIKICDRCGAALNNQADMEITSYVHPFGTSTYELCPCCARELLDWLNNDDAKKGLEIVYGEHQK